MATGAVYMTRGIFVAAYKHAGFPVVNFTSGKSETAMAAAPAPNKMRFNKVLVNRFLNNHMINTKPKWGFSVLLFISMIVLGI